MPLRFGCISATSETRDDAGVLRLAAAPRWIRLAEWGRRRAGAVSKGGLSPNVLSHSPSRPQLRTTRSKLRQTPGGGNRSEAEPKAKPKIAEHSVFKLVEANGRPNPNWKSRRQPAALRASAPKRNPPVFNDFSCGRSLNPYRRKGLKASLQTACGDPSGRISDVCSSAFTRSRETEMPMESRRLGTREARFPGVADELGANRPTAP
jgi:hypothetical protein